MAKKDSDYGLAPLTFKEGARVLGLETGAWMIWVMERARPSESEWSEWKNDRRTLPEKLVRLYLVEHPQRSLTPARAAVAKGDRPPMNAHPIHLETER